MAQNYFGKTDSRGSTPVTYNFTPLSSAKAFSTTKPYTVGEYCFYEGVLYRCKTDKAAGAWAPTKFEEANLGEHLTDAEKALLTKAEIDGYYDGMTVGNAEQIVGTVFEEDDTAYNYRTTGGSAEVGDRAYVESITGGSLPWNQLLQNGNFASSDYWYYNNVASHSISDNTLTFTVSQKEGVVSNSLSGYGDDILDGHKYLCLASIKLTTGTDRVFLQLRNGNGVANAGATVNSTNWQVVGGVINGVYFSGTYVRVIDMRLSDWDAIQVKNVMLIDLTAMFGSTIADYIYALETAHAGDGVAWFKRYFPKDYYAYHAVGMEHVNAVAAKTVGFNQWDEEWEVGYFWEGADGDIHYSSNTTTCIRNKNLIPVLPNTEYYINSPSAGYAQRLAYFDSNQDVIRIANLPNNNTGVTFTTPSNCCYLSFFMEAYGTTYKNDINIYIHWDNSRDGDYEPYNLHTYPLADLTLRGIPKKDESGNLYFDGDRYLPDGTVERRYGIVDLGTLTWSIGGLSQADTGVRKRIRTYSMENIAKETVDNNTAGNIVCEKFPTASYSRGYSPEYGLTNVIAIDADGDISAFVKDSDYADAAAFKTAMSGVYLVYELATPTTEEADPYQYPMVVDNWGTEEFVDGLVESGDRDVAIPVGHETKYPPNLKDKLESAANNPDADGAYVLTHDGGSNTYTPLASNATIQNIIARLEALEGGGENE